MAKHHPDLVMCRKQPGVAIGRLCEKCKCSSAQQKGHSFLIIYYYYYYYYYYYPLTHTHKHIYQYNRRRPLRHLRFLRESTYTRENLRRMQLW